MMGCNSSTAVGVIDQTRIKPIKNRKNRPGTSGKLFEILNKKITYLIRHGN